MMGVANHKTFVTDGDPHHVFRFRSPPPSKPSKIYWIATRAVILLSSYSPSPRLIDPHHRPPPLSGSRFRVVFRSFSSRFPVVFESFSSRDSSQNRRENDSKTTEKRLEIDSPGGGSVVGVDESGGMGCSWTTISLRESRTF